MRKHIKTKLREGFNSFTTDEKWERLEKEVKNAIIPIIEKNKEDFGQDSYAVIDAIKEIFDGMFEKVRR